VGIEENCEEFEESPKRKSYNISERILGVFILYFLLFWIWFLILDASPRQFIESFNELIITQWSFLSEHEILIVLYLIHSILPLKKMPNLESLISNKNQKEGHPFLQIYEILHWTNNNLQRIPRSWLGQGSVQCTSQQHKRGFLLKNMSQICAAKGGLSSRF
jgi:hypothetical protein